MGTSDLLAEAHNEKLVMPAVLCREDYDAWLMRLIEPVPVASID